MLVFAFNLMITLFWVGLSQDLSPVNLIFGFALGYFLLYFLFRETSHHPYFLKIPRFINFALFYFFELIRSNIEVAWDVLTPRDLTQPGIVRVPLELKSEFQIALLMNLITFTPGSLSVDLSADKKTLYVHGMFIKNKEEFVKSIKEGLESRIIKLFE